MNSLIPIDKPASSVASHQTSHSSAGSNASKKSRQYRTISATSKVDESLFGESQRVKDRQTMLEEKWRSTECDQTNNSHSLEEQAASRRLERPPRRANGKDGKERIRVVSKDLIRQLIVPEDDEDGKTLVLPFCEYSRIKSNSKVLTLEEIAEQQRLAKEAEEAAQAESQKRRAFLKEMDMKRMKNERLTDLEEEARVKAEHLLQKAIEQRQDQEDEIKKLNELILNAKIQAIRDAQIIEKQVIKDELSCEDKRLDVMMEIDRKNAILIQEEIDKKRKEEEMIGATQIMKQITDNEKERLLELEKKDQENMAAQRYIAQLMEDELQKRIQQKTKQDLHREELNKANAEILKRKAGEKDIDRLIEAKVLEYQLQKAEREAAYEAEQEKIKAEKEKEIAKLRALQERSQDEQAERDALRAKRAMEQAERDWRKKERDEQLKKASTEQELLLARAAQTEQKEHYLAVQAARDRFEFERVLRAQKEIIEKERREGDEMKRKRSIYAEEVRRQIKEKEKQKIAERNAFFEEGIRMEEEARLRKLRLEDAKARKFRELSHAGIPEKYLAQVERKINQPHRL